MGRFNSVLATKTIQDMKQTIKLVLLTLSTLILTGCGYRIVVKDAIGIPILGASVSGQSLSMGTQVFTTDTDGAVKVPTSISVQDVKWIRVECPGYESVQVDVSSISPMVITLTKK